MLPLRRTLHAAVYVRDDPRVRSVFAALGFATFYVFWIIKPAVEPQQEALYHWSGDARSFFLPAALDFLGFWLVIFLLLLAARTPGRTRAGIWGALLFFTPWFVSQTLHELDLKPITQQLDRVLFLGAVFATIWLIARWRPAYAKRFESVIGPATTILIFTSFFGAFMLCQLALSARRASRLIGDFPLHHAQTAAAIQPHRVLWIVLDELSYDQTYEHRFPGLKLPAFDALAADATVFTQARPFNIYTEIVLPGLLAGKPFDRMRASPAVELSVHNLATGKWQPFEQHDTVFQDALNAGYSTAVAGWYNPYCRIVPAVVDSCYWTLRSSTNLIVDKDSLPSNMLGPLKLLTWMVLNVAPSRVRLYGMDRLHIPERKEFITQLHIEDYVDLDAHAQRLLRDRSYGFVLLHLPVPHPWGIYDRHTDKFIITGSSYVNNLALADKCLAGIRRTLEQTGQWDSSTVVVMGDHSWRTKAIWYIPRINYAWSKEDELASHGGQYDPRPAYIVKLPGQTIGTRIDTPYSTVNTRALFDAIMDHKIDNADELSAWVQSLAARPEYTAQTP